MADSWIETTVAPDNVNLKTVAGTHNVIEVVDVDAATTGIATTNSNVNGHALAATGKTNLDGNVTIPNDHTLTVDGNIIANNNITGGINTVLNLGTDVGAQHENVAIGRAGLITNVRSNLIVGNEDDEGFIDAAETDDDPALPQNLNIGTGATTDDIVLGKAGSNTLVKGYLKVGIDEICCIDAPTAVDDLKMGSMTTKDVLLSRSGQTTRIMGSATVGDGEHGMVDASEGPTYDLKLGTDVDLTRNVIVGRDGQSVTCEAVLKLDSHDLVLDMADSAPAGWGFRKVDTVNPVTHKLHVYVAGVHVGYFQSVAPAWVPTL